MQKSHVPEDDIFGPPPSPTRCRDAEKVEKYKTEETKKNKFGFSRHRTEGFLLQNRPLPAIHVQIYFEANFHQRLLAFANRLKKLEGVENKFPSFFF